VHFLVADRAGRVAAIEFLDGEMVAHTGKDLPIPALTNTVYADALAAWKRTGAQPGGSSEARFTRAAERVRSARFKSASEAVRHAFDTLSDVANRSHTMWSIVYEPAAGRVWFRTRDHRPIRSIDLARLDFSCSAPPIGLDLEARLEGDVTERLTRFGTRENLALVRRSVRATPFLKSMPDPAIDAVARYPDSLACVAAP
jgi:penicillin V acylase-like amidase (Ntn superfamily)